VLEDVSRLKVVKLESIMVEILRSLIAERDNFNRVVSEAAASRDKAQEKIAAYLGQVQQVLRLEGDWTFDDNLIGFKRVE